MTSIPVFGALPREEGQAGRLRLATWNMTGWSAVKAHTVFSEIGVDVLAIQETHLAAIPLQWAHRTMQQVGGHLHHGHPVKAVAGRASGRSCVWDLLSERELQ